MTETVKPKIRLKKSGIKKPTKPRPKKAKPKPMKSSKRLNAVGKGLESPLVKKMLIAAKKKYGDRIQGYVRPMPPAEVVPTGFPEIDDKILGCGGLVKGKVGEIFGPESGGKTTICLGIIAAFQKMGLSAAFIDMEHSMDPLYASANGVDVNNWLYFKPLYGEECCEMILMCMNAGIDLVVVDSWGALFPKDAIDKPMDKKVALGLRAQMIERTVNKSLEARHVHGNMLVCINQVRDNIGAAQFESKEKTAGGRHWRHSCHWRIQVKKGFKNRRKSDGVATGIECKLFGAKNKGGSPFQNATMEIVFGTGISLECSLIDEGLRLGILEKSGAWINWGKEKLGQGRDKARVALEKDNDLLMRLKKAIGLKKKEGATVVDGEFYYEELDELPDDNIDDLGGFTLDGDDEVNLDE